jgi:hypothetical protein
VRRKEPKLPTKSQEARSNEARARADASFRKEERAKDGAKAMMEYLDNSRQVRERTERLRALRLAKEAADQKAADKKATDKTAADKKVTAANIAAVARKRSAAKV